MDEVNEFLFALLEAVLVIGSLTWLLATENSMEIC